MRHRLLGLCLVAALGAGGCGRLFRSSPKPTVPAPVAEARIGELWVDPGDIPAKDLFHGPGGAERAPKPGATFQFVAQDTTGFSPGWDVKDAHGTEWSVKLGPEAQTEVVASRLIWALGYRQPPTYYVDDWTLEGGPQPGRGEPGRFRPSLPGGRRTGEWSWEKNPFGGTPEMRRLLVLMRILNNWDLLDRNNTIYEFAAPHDGAGRWYVVIDVGASLGRARKMSLESGTRNAIEDFEKTSFVKGINEEGFVRFEDLGKWHTGLFAKIQPEDVRWVCDRLSELSPQQWDDLFRAAKYEPALARRFITALQTRVAEGRRLTSSPEAAAASGEGRP